MCSAAHFDGALAAIYSIHCPDSEPAPAINNFQNPVRRTFMNAKSIQADQVEVQDMATDHPHTDGHADDQADEYPLLPGFISFYQNAQQIQDEAGQLYATNDTDLRDMPISLHDSLHDDIPLQLAKTYQK
jgi:hypothetical protein